MSARQIPLILVMIAFSGAVAALIAAPGRGFETTTRRTIERVEEAPPPPPPPPDECEVIEKKLAAQGCRLAPLSMAENGTTEGIAVVRFAFSAEAPTQNTPAPDEPAGNVAPAPPDNHLRGFYLRHPVQRRATIFQFAEGSEPPGVLSLYPSAIVHDGPDKPPNVIAEEAGWEAFEIVPPDRQPAASREVVYTFEVVDEFMRTDFCRDDGWQPVSGRWQLTKYGGGLPTTDDAAANAKFQRAMNPFSVTGWAPEGTSGTLAYNAPTARGDSYLVEARFHLGTPGAVATKRSYIYDPLPTFLIAQGDLNGDQAAFGWYAPAPGAPARWSLCVRRGQDAWTILKTWAARPPRTNWVRAGIAISNGHTAIAMLDGRPLGTCELGRMVSGSFQIHTGLEGRKVEFDDIVARPRAEVESLGQPIFRKSRNFGAKNLFDRAHDPVQYDYWARAANAWLVGNRNDPGLGLSGICAIARLPLMGDFTYRSTPALPLGDYRFFILKRPQFQCPEDKLAEFSFTKTQTGWKQAGNAFTLEFGRRGDELRLHTPDGWKPLDAHYTGGGKPTGALHLAVAPPAEFKPEDHLLYSQNTWHYMFEQAPSDFYWRDGLFGMNFRWSCQPGWNFMSGRSPELAAVFTKDAYYGDQVVESFMAFSMTLPAQQQYYLRRDLCVSYCTNGRDLDSGYTLIFGGYRNSKTLLLKRGQVLAATNTGNFLIPKQPGHLHVHWLWWNFIFRKTANRITITYNDQTLFDVVDPDPIDGGHVAFWTVGNGFVLSRITVVAQQRRQEPEKALVEWDHDPTDWQPLYPDAVILRSREGTTTVENPFGGGSFAARITTQADLSATPVLELPLRLDPAARINLHIEIDRRPWIVQITAPLADMEYVLVPSADAAYPFGRPVIEGGALDRIVLGKAVPQNGLLRVNIGEMLKARGVPINGVKQISLTLGNSSNADYLLAGFGGNRSGTTYTLGQPKWTAAR